MSEHESSRSNPRPNPHSPPPLSLQLLFLSIQSPLFRRLPQRPLREAAAFPDPNPQHLRLQHGDERIPAAKPFSRTHPPLQKAAREEVPDVEHLHISVRVEVLLDAAGARGRAAGAQARDRIWAGRESVRADVAAQFLHEMRGGWDGAEGVR